MDAITIPGPFAALVLILYAAAALVLLGVLVLGLLSTRDQARLKYSREIAKMELENDLEWIARQSASRRIP
jgi:hypothetical protein